MYIYIHIYIYIYICQIVHYNSCFNLSVLHNSFHKQGSKINKNDIFYVSEDYLLRSFSCNYTFNKFTSLIALVALVSKFFVIDIRHTAYICLKSLRMNENT